MDGKRRHQHSNLLRDVLVDTLLGAHVAHRHVYDDDPWCSHMEDLDEVFHHDDDTGEHIHFGPSDCWPADHDRNSHPVLVEGRWGFMHSHRGVERRN